MARCIDLFIDVVETDSGGGGAHPWSVGPLAPVGPAEPVGPAVPAGLAEMAAELTAITGLRLSEEPGGGSWVAEVDGARVVLAEHDLVDDRQLTLSKYRYDLFARVPSADANNSPEAALLRRILALVKADGRFRALLVWDLQNVIGQAAGAGRGAGGVGGGGGVGVAAQPAQ